MCVWVFELSVVRVGELKCFAFARKLLRHCFCISEIQKSKFLLCNVYFIKPFDLNIAQICNPTVFQWSVNSYSANAGFLAWLVKCIRSFYLWHYVFISEGVCVKVFPFPLKCTLRVLDKPIPLLNGDIMRTYSKIFTVVIFITVMFLYL